MSTAPPVPPYDLGVLERHLPLTLVQRTRLLRWYRRQTGKSLPTSISDHDLLYAVGKVAGLVGTITGGGGIGGLIEGVGAGAGGVALGVGDTITSVVDFLRKLADPHLWVRVGEVAVGGLLIGVGVHAALKGGSPTQSAAHFKPTSLGGLGTAGSRSGSIHYNRTVNLPN